MNFRVDGSRYCGEKSLLFGEKKIQIGKIKGKIDEFLCRRGDIKKELPTDKKR